MMTLKEFKDRCREVAETVDREAQKAAVALAAVAVAVALLLGALMALEGVGCGGSALERNIREGVYPAAVCERCGAALDDGSGRCAAEAEPARMASAAWRIAEETGALSGQSEFGAWLATRLHDGHEHGFHGQLPAGERFSGGVLYGPEGARP